jgi:hypothetical protein
MTIIVDRGREQPVEMRNVLFSFGPSKKGEWWTLTSKIHGSVSPERLSVRRTDVAIYRFVVRNAHLTPKVERVETKIRNLSAALRRYDVYRIYLQVLDYKIVRSSTLPFDTHF